MSPYFLVRMIQLMFADPSILYATTNSAEFRKCHGSKNCLLNPFCEIFHIEINTKKGNWLAIDVLDINSYKKLVQAKIAHKFYLALQ